MYAGLCGCGRTPSKVSFIMAGQAKQQCFLETFCPKVSNHLLYDVVVFLKIVWHADQHQNTSVHGSLQPMSQGSSCFNHFNCLYVTPGSVYVVFAGAL